MCRRTGWTWEYVWENMDVEKLNAMEQEWGEEPLTHRLVAAFMGVKQTSKTSLAPKQYGDLNELLTLFPTGKM